MNRYWNKKIGTAVTLTNSTDVFNAEWYGKLQFFIKAQDMATVGTISVQVSPNNIDWFSDAKNTFTFTGAEMGETAKTLAYVHTATPYVRVTGNLTGWQFDCWIAFNENN